jgi:hypothetical protein
VRDSGVWTKSTPIVNPHEFAKHGESRSVGVVCAAAVDEVGHGIERVEHDEGLTKCVDVDNITSRHLVSVSAEPYESEIAIPYSSFHRENSIHAKRGGMSHRFPMSQRPGGPGGVGFLRRALRDQ